MSKKEEVNLYWPDGTFKTQQNAFNVNHKRDPDLATKKIERNAQISARSTRNVREMRSQGKEPAKLSPLSLKPRHGQIVIVGRDASQKQRDTTDAIRRGGI